jgi:hypothetical protein
MVLSTKQWDLLSKIGVGRMAKADKKHHQQLDCPGFFKEYKLCIQRKR